MVTEVFWVWGTTYINTALGYKLRDTSIFNIMSCPHLCLQSDGVVILICCSFQCQITLHHSFFFSCLGLQISCWILSGPIKRGQSHSQPLINQQEQSFLCLCCFHREPHSSFLNFLKQHSVICLYDKCLQIRSLLSLRTPLCLIFFFLFSL